MVLGLAALDGICASAAFAGSGSASNDSLAGAIPAASARHMPSTAAQYRALQSEIAKSRPQVLEAQRRSTELKLEADALRQKLIDTAAHVQKLEQEALWLDAEIRRLEQLDHVLSADFIGKRAEVTELVAVLQRMQHDMPPVLALRADDALAAAHSSMLIGAALPRIYVAAAELSQKLQVLQRTRLQLYRRREESARNSITLTQTRTQLDQMLAIKAQEADEAGSRYEDLAGQLQSASDQAANLETLLQKVASLRAESPGSGFSVVSGRNGHSWSQRTLLRPVVGRMVAGDEAGGSARAPGVSFVAPPAAQVVAPADAQVLFAGAYHKAGQVLILQTADGYDLVLAGLDRVDVRSGDHLLAGEPVGRMPRSVAAPRLYFELRQNGKGLSPAPRLQSDRKG
ncbi:MAG TPA: peptidoglycan DD-metalloendopeptidase family protein [Rhizomicrobium sp.]|jgi:septal ring factor EnvC (AmiA/AmiB activator)|nr:peptidoglycan DD-metalloendopeptidase family protein [Rhizomicrobium sp.]